MTRFVRTWLRCFATAAVIVGPIFGLIAAFLTLTTISFIHHASHATGFVTGFTQRTDEEKNVTYAPTFAFRAPSGELIDKQSGTGDNPPSFSVGQQVPVLFDPSDPHNARLNSRTQLWLMPITFGSIAIVFTPTGLLLLRRPSIATAPRPFRTITKNA